MSATQTTPRLTLTRRECAQALGLSEKTVYELTKAGQLPSVKFGARGIRYPVKQLEEYIERQLSSSAK